MPIDNCIVPDPEPLKTTEQVKKILIKLDKFERKTKKEAVVTLSQNRTLGDFYEITSKEQSIDGIQNPRTCELYCRFWPSSYFEELKEKLKQPTNN